MRELIAWELMSLDGYFEGASPWDLDFHNSVWGGELEEFSLAQGRAIGTLLFGRRTYEGMFGHWAKATGPTADMMNTLEKAVASNTLEHADWSNTRLLKGDAVNAVKALKAEEGKDIYVFGSAALLASLLDAGLVDEYRVCVAPVLLGAGNPLFKPGVRHDLALTGCRTLQTGGVILTYRTKG